MNSGSSKASFIVLLLASLLLNSCATAIRKDTVTVRSAMLDRLRFNEAVTGIYHNIVVLKFINSVPIRILQPRVGETPIISGRDVSVAWTKRFVYLPSERSNRDVRRMRELKLGDTVVRAEIKAVNDLLSGRNDIDIRPYFSRKVSDLKQERRIVEQLVKVEVADLNNYYNVILQNHPAASTLIDTLSQLRIVEVAYHPPIPRETDDPPLTPNYAGNQNYLDPAPNGIDAAAVWNTPGGIGTSVRIIDIEGVWVLDHEDLDPPFFVDNRQWLIDAGNTFFPEFSLFGRNHGTAVLGIIVARDDGHGVTGIAHGSDHGVVSVIRESLPEIDPHLFYRMSADAINVAAANLSAGDVILVEQHAPFVPPGWAVLNYCNCEDSTYVAVENWQAEFDAIFSATARGIIVVEAAGNGGMNLDSGIYDGRFDRSVRDSGAIIVGAAGVYEDDDTLTTNHSAICCSNSGSRVDLHSWGRKVWSLGEGDGARIDGANERQWYTNSFGGTSAASAIVAGAVAAVQGARIGAGNTPLGPADMRRLLVSTGTPHTGTRLIGSQPDLRAALNSLAINPVPDYGTCTMPAAHSDECGGATCQQKVESVCWDECWFFGLFCEQQCLLRLLDEYECVNQ